jgi:uncharacterized protein (TIGR03435 family)
VSEGRKLAVITLLSGLGAFAQSFDSFEVATIKPSAPDDRAGRFIRMESANRFVAKNQTVALLLAAAYNLPERLVSGGPAWVVSDRFEIVAATGSGVRPSLDEQMSMLRKLLADRFQLTFHRERKELSIYALTALPSGPKLKESEARADASPALINVIFPDRVQLPARNATMSQFASMLQRSVLDRPVVDQTGLRGRFDFDLEWTPDESQFGGKLPPPPTESPKASLFAALRQQLGLRLDATKGPMDVLVIDRVARPSEN